MTRRWISILVALGVGVAWAGAALAVPLVYISKVRHMVSLETIQLKNAEAFPVDIGGWMLSGNLGEFVIPQGSQINGGGTINFSIVPITDGIAGHIELIDDLKGPRGFALVDGVRFGCEGGAPAPPAAPDSAAIVRVPDPSTLPPQNPPNDEIWWTVDLLADFGNPFNAAPVPNLGSSLLINELRVGYGAPPDSLELFNPTGAPVFLNAWFVTSAAGAEPLNGIVPAFGFLGLELLSVDLETTQRLDLFDRTGVRVDQKAICGAPFSECYGCCPDGAAPSHGHDYFTSGGGASWFPLWCSIGKSNSLHPPQPCSPSGVPDPPVEESRSWGEIKVGYRE